MAQLPESLTEIKEYCSNCGRVLGKGSSYVRAIIEQVTSGDEAILIDCDNQYFCKECLKKGIYINLRNPDTRDVH